MQSPKPCVCALNLWPLLQHMYACVLNPVPELVFFRKPKCGWAGVRGGPHCPRTAAQARNPAAEGCNDLSDWPITPGQATTSRCCRSPCLQGCVSALPGGMVNHQLIARPIHSSLFKPSLICHWQCLTGGVGMIVSDILAQAAGSHPQTQPLWQRCESPSCVVVHLACSAPDEEVHEVCTCLHLLLVWGVTPCR